jgi:hypothetical protein
VEENLLTPKKRDEALVAMTQDVAEHVLEDNHSQNNILTIMEWECRHRLRQYQNLIQHLEDDALSHLNRDQDDLPDNHMMESRLAGHHSPLLRPELCVLLSHTKNSLKQHLMGQLDAQSLSQVLVEYFPPLIINQFEKHIGGHLLGSELLATLMANKIINLLGPCFVFETAASLNISPAKAVMMTYQSLQILGCMDIKQKIHQSLEGNHIDRAGELIATLRDVITLMCRINLQLDGYHYQPGKLLSTLEANTPIESRITQGPLLLMATNMAWEKNNSRGSILKNYKAISRIVDYGNIFTYCAQVKQAQTWEKRILGDLLFDITHHYAALVLNYEHMEMVLNTPGSTALDELRQINQSILKALESKQPGDTGLLLYLEKILASIC